MFERFTEPARQVVVLAQDESRALGHDFIGTEHLLLGLLRDEEGIAARALGQLGVTLSSAQAQVMHIDGVGEPKPAGQIPFTEGARRALEASLEQAVALGHGYVGTEHLLLGLVHDPDTMLDYLLSLLDVDADTIRSAVLAALGGTKTDVVREPMTREGAPNAKYDDPAGCVFCCATVLPADPNSLILDLRPRRRDATARLSFVCHASCLRKAVDQRLSLAETLAGIDFDTPPPSA